MEGLTGWARIPRPGLGRGGGGRSKLQPEASHDLVLSSIPEHPWKVERPMSSEKRGWGRVLGFSEMSQVEAFWIIWGSSALKW